MLRLAGLSRQRSLRIALSLVVAGAVACTPPPTRDLTLPNGRTIPILGVGPAVGPMGMLDRARARDTVFLVRYVMTDDEAQQVAERDDLLAWAGAQAQQAAIRIVGLQRTEYPYGRLLLVTHSGLSFFERDASGAWVRFRKPGNSPK